ncbi:hypothetical protein ACTID9_14525 [Brevibacillus fluminis]|uniref:hypothetical protein n=1 Tax=Brevibacillus fluminis TaxID=511487 RepID=UPI003F8C8C84
MTMQNHYQLSVGDWVKAKAKSGELLHGFIESVDLMQGIANVYVVDSDLADSVGRSVELYTHSVEKYPVTAIETEEQILDAIDLALLTRDEAWFRDLYADLIIARQRSADREKKRSAALRTRNRLRPSDMPS